jgi:outer membrane protein assembly factor BamB
VAEHVMPLLLSVPPALADGLLIGRTGLGELAAVDVRTGEIAWQLGLGALPTSPPVVAGDVVHVGLADGRVARVRLDGSPLDAVPIGDTPVYEVVAAHRVLIARVRDAIVMRGPAELPDTLTGRDTAGGTVELPAP